MTKNTDGTQHGVERAPRPIRTFHRVSACRVTPASIMFFVSAGAVWGVLELSGTYLS